MALPSNSELIVFKPNDKEYTELARIKVSDTPIYAHPVIAGNRIFIKESRNGDDVDDWLDGYHCHFGQTFP